MAMMVPLAQMPFADFNQIWPKNNHPKAEAVKAQNTQPVRSSVPNTNDVFKPQHANDAFKLKNVSPTVTGMGKKLDVMA